jgi:hypothetical protein
MSSFIEDPKGNATYIPDLNPELCQGIGRGKKKRIRNTMDEAEASRSVALCSKCNNPGHTYKKCTATSTLAIHLVRQMQMMLPNLRLVEVHLRDVDVDVVATTMKECIEFSCLISELFVIMSYLS